MAMAISRAMVRPRPTPSVAAAPPAPAAPVGCTWWKGWKMRASSAAPMPSPVSATVSVTQPGRSPGQAARQMWPRRVNFTALPSRLFSTWRSRAASPRTQQGRGSCSCSRNCSPLSAARSANSSACRSSSAVRSKSSSFSAKWPASMRETSSRSLIRPSSWVPELSISSSRCVRVGSLASRCSRRVRPSMPCSGVRSSWLTLARKRWRSALCSRARRSAASFSAASASACSRSSMPVARRCEVARAVDVSRAASNSWPIAAKGAMSSCRCASPRASGSSIGST